MIIDNNTKIYIAGHTGLVGSAVLNTIRDKFSKCKIITKTHSELDLFNRNDVFDFFAKERPDIVICCAAKVGGILANSSANSQFLSDNITINNNLLNACKTYIVKRIIFLGSSCIYPKKCYLPITEDQLLSNYLEPTNEGYALAKICGIKLCQFYNKEIGENRFISLMPCNLYGPNDNYHLEHSHVFPKFIRLFTDACTNNTKEITLWGSGKPYREFMHVLDLANAIVKILEQDKLDYDIYNVGSGIEITISELANKMNSMICNNSVKINWDTSKPDGTFHKLMDSSRIRSLGWEPIINIDIGIRSTQIHYLLEKNSGNLKEK